jgi:hypothetical protein
VNEKALYPSIIKELREVGIELFRIQDSAGKAPFDLMGLTPNHQTIVIEVKVNRQKTLRIQPNALSSSASNKAQIFHNSIAQSPSIAPIAEEDAYRARLKSVLGDARLESHQEAWLNSLSRGAARAFILVYNANVGRLPWTLAEVGGSDYYNVSIGNLKDVFSALV